MDEGLNLILEHPGSALAMLMAVVAFVAQAAITFETVRYMRKNMVTKKDLRIAILTLIQDLADDFVTRKELASFLREHKAVE